MSSKIVKLDETTHVKITYKTEKQYGTCKIKVKTSGSDWSENDKNLLKVKETGFGFECKFPKTFDFETNSLLSLDYCQAEYLYFALKTYREENGYNV